MLSAEKLLCCGIILALGIISSAPSLADDDRDRICHAGFARDGRPSESDWKRLKMAAMARANLPWSERNEFELDHIVPRCLDGSNDLDNLQLQPWEEAQDKDALEVRICQQYCSGFMTLEQARAHFKREWP